MLTQHQPAHGSITYHRTPTVSLNLPSQLQAFRYSTTHSFRSAFSRKLRTATLHDCYVPPLQALRCQAKHVLQAQRWTHTRCRHPPGDDRTPHHAAPPTLHTAFTQLSTLFHHAPLTEDMTAHLPTPHRESSKLHTRHWHHTQ